MRLDGFGLRDYHEARIALGLWRAGFDLAGRGWVTYA